VWQKHIRTLAHREKANGPSRQVQLGGTVIDSVAEAAKRQRLADEQVAHRLRVAKMVYSHSLSMNAVEEEGDEGAA
jgi:hypothetical protein